MFSDSTLIWPRTSKSKNWVNWPRLDISEVLTSHIDDYYCKLIESNKFGSLHFQYWVKEVAGVGAALNSSGIRKLVSDNNVQENLGY